MAITLHPDKDDAARTALFVYARLTGNEDLYAILEGANPPASRFESLISAGDLDADAYQVLHALSRPGGTMADVEATLKRLELEPVTLVCRNTQTVFNDEGVVVRSAPAH